MSFCSSVSVKSTTLKAPCFGRAAAAGAVPPIDSSVNDSSKSTPSDPLIKADGYVRIASARQHPHNEVYAARDCGKAEQRKADLVWVEGGPAGRKRPTA